ncbi:hypothetical protein DY000_02016618 [Brassica cretica]|uniref:Uncharacterized protein n=1 Tax=Brassica cretica TaxID=69181 RepID=A0ABQ7CN20_BRACR|nr:hypothetical protein DY000_02016618 [Brassica cretica]
MSLHDLFVSDGSSWQHVDVMPKVEFSADSIDPEEVDAYWTARGEVKPPVSGLWVPSPFKANPVAGCPSRICPNGLAAIRRFCRVSESVEFRLPEAGEVALSPPEGYFTCYEAYLMQCHLWFPITELIVKLLNRFNLSISQVNPCGLQHLVRILVLSYELGITLDTDHLKALEQFFFVRVSDASVETSAILVFTTGWGKRSIPDSERLLSLLVRRAAALYHSRFQPDLPTEEGSETKRDRSKARKDKHLMVVEDAVDGQLSPDNILKDYLDSQAGESNEVPDSSKAARMVNGAHMARFKAEVADNEIARLKDELESSRRRERESFEKEVNHAYSQGKREVVKVMKSRRDKFSQKFGELKGRYKVLADYRECCGTVGGLYLTQFPDYSFTSKYARQTGYMAEKDRDFKISKAEMGDLGETGEVDQPVAPLDVNHYSIGRSMSGNFDLGD